MTTCQTREGLAAVCLPDVALLAEIRADFRLLWGAVQAFERGALIRTTGDIIAMSPPLIITKGQIDELIDHVREVLRMID